MLKLAFKRIAHVGVPSWGVGLAALLVSSFALGVTQVLLGAQASLQRTLDRLGADLLVVPEGAAVSSGSALLLGISDLVWMPEDTLEKISAVPGVALASPQLYLTTLEDNVCCPGKDILLIAYDPETDFTVRPWLEDEIQGGLKPGEAVVGSEIATQFDSADIQEETIDIAGFPVHLVAALEPTGTRIDHALFFSFETASELAVQSNLTLPAPGGEAGKISTVMVLLEPEVDLYETAVELMHLVPGITPITSLELFQAYRGQFSALLNSVIVVWVITLTISLLLTGLIFSMAANERRGELGVLRALGATHRTIFQTLILETSLLSVGGGLLGCLLTGAGIAAFHRTIIQKMGIPFLLPSSQMLILQIGIGLAAALVTVTAAVLLPAYRISHQEPAHSMRM